MAPFAQRLLTTAAGNVVGTGWLPSRPDLRDYHVGHSAVAPALKALNIQDPFAHHGALPSSVDLTEWCPPIEDQGALGSCTAFAAVGIVEYFQRRSSGAHVDGSHLFTYKATRNLMGVTGDTGAFMREAMASLVYCGIAPERYWPYTDQDPFYDHEPSSFVYSLAENYQAPQYLRHDPPGTNRSRDQVLKSVKTFLAAGVPSMFGFWGFGSFDDSDEPGHIPFPCRDEQSDWGHAVVAVGYDDERTITNTVCDEITTGALLIRNSWGKSWGDGGYGWMPYRYVVDWLADDFWSLLSMDWVATEAFGL